MILPNAIRLGTACAVLMFGSVTPAQTTRSLPAPFVTEIHGGPASPYGHYGTWVSAASYKAAFHDGFAFYPLLGAAYDGNLPLRWTTLEVTVGGEVVAIGDRDRPRRSSPHRVEFEHGGFTEVYDVVPEGIEQSFVFGRALGSGGDLVLAGRVDTELAADPVGDAHQELLFRGPDGEAIVRYGTAAAFDAVGQRVAVTTAWDGQNVELRIGADFMARAVFPVTLDPLISRVNLATGTAPVQGLDLVRAHVGTSSNLMMVYSRVFAGNDVDSFGCVSDPDFGNPVMVFSDVSASWSTKGGRCAYVGDAQRWAAVFEREFTAPTTSVILTYFHVRDDGVLNSGVSSTLAVPAGTTARNPDVGGRHVGGGQNAFVVYQTDPTTTQQNTANTEVWGVLVHAPSGAAASTPTTLDWSPAGTAYDREHPTVVKMSDGNQGLWIVSWHEFFRYGGPDDWDINLTRVTFAGQKMAQRYRMGLSVTPWNKRYPRLAGGNSRFMLAMSYGATSASPTANEIHVQRFDWPDSVWDPVIQSPQVLVADSQTPDFAFLAIAFDSNTRSHWAVTYQRGLNSPGDLFVARVGPQGGVIESQTLFSSPTSKGSSTAVTFAPENGGSFPIAYATDEAGDPVFGNELLYPPVAQNTLYGTGCGGQIGATSPYGGSEFFTVTLTGVQPGQAGVLAVSGVPDNFSFGPGMPGCFLNVTLPAIVVPVITVSPGDAEVSFAIPELLPPGFTFFFQWLYLDPGANPAGVSTTAGLRSQFE